MNDKEKNGLTKPLVALLLIVYIVVFGLTVLFNWFVFKEGWKVALIISIKFWGIIAIITAVWCFIQDQFQKDAKRCVIWCAIIAVAAGAWYYTSTADSREEADQQAFIKQVGTDIDDYFPEDTVQEFVYNYVESHLDEIKSHFNLYSEDDMDSLYNDAQDAMQSAYADGWSDACDTYGIVEEADSTAATAVPESPTAYITPTGKRYHLSQSCAGENAIKTTIAEASDKGYTPCENCAQ